MVIYTLMRKNECYESAVSEWLKNRRHVVCKNVLRLDAIFSLKRKTLLQYLEPWF